LKLVKFDANKWNSCLHYVRCFFVTADCNAHKTTNNIQSQIDKCLHCRFMNISSSLEMLFRENCWFYRSLWYNKWGYCKN